MGLSVTQPGGSLSVAGGLLDPINRRELLITNGLKEPHALRLGTQCEDARRPGIAALGHLIHKTVGQ